MGYDTVNPAYMDPLLSLPNFDVSNSAFSDDDGYFNVTTTATGILDVNCTTWSVNESQLIYCINTSLPHPPCPKFELSFFQGVTVLLYIIVCIVGLTGNTLVIYVVLRYSKMQTVTNMYILNLALADELLLFGIPLFVATASFGFWPFGSHMCKVYMTLTCLNQFSSSIFLAVMSTDRYIAVCHPISSPKYRTPFISKIVCWTAWTVSALMMVPIFMYANVLEGDCQRITCNIFWPESEHMNGQTAFTLYAFILGFAIPLTLIFVFYSLVVRKLQRVGPRNKSKEKKKSHRKVTKLVMTVITVYVLCWLPYWISQVALLFSPPNQDHESTAIVIVFVFVGCLSYSNSAMNPVLYAFLSDNFKKSFLKACQCAAGKDVNAQLHMENSVFPRRHHRGGSERSGRPRSAEPNESDEEMAGNNDDREPSTAITMTSRSNNHSTSGGSTDTTMTNVGGAIHTVDEKDPMLVKNGIHSNKTNTQHLLLVPPPVHHHQQQHLLSSTEPTHV